MRYALSTAIAGVASLLVGCSEPDPPLAPSYRVTLQAEGGELPFRMDLVEDGEGGAQAPSYDAYIHNGEEVLRVPDVEVTRNPLKVVVRFAHYDSTLSLKVDHKKGGLSGAWVKPRAGGEVATLLARATPEDAGVRFEAHPSGRVNAAAFDGRWRVDFLTEGDTPAPPGVAVFDVRDDGLATGTIMTATGDYRYLAGRADMTTLRLSAFDGGHAILVRASPDPDGKLLGDTSWGNWGSETWAATRDDDASLPDPGAITSVTPEASIDDVALRTLDGVETTLRAAVDELGAVATVVMIFGSWCPNSADCTTDLVPLLASYREQGLGVVGLAHEFTGDAARDAPRVEAYRQIHAVPWPLYLAGPVDKAEASATLPIIDRLNAFPTLIFLDKSGIPVSVLTGYNGPAAGAEHARFLAQVERQVQQLLADAP